MTPLALTLVLLAAACHAAWNVLAKRIGGGNHFVLLGASMVCLVWAPFVLGWGIEPVLGWGLTEWGVVLASSLVNIAYFRALLRGYAVSDMSVVYPVARGSAPLMTSLCAVAWLGESMSWQAAGGMLAIVTGVFVIAGGPGLWRRRQEPRQRRLARAGMWWGGVTGALVAAYSVIDAYAVKVLHLSPLLLIYFSNVLRVPLMLPAVARERRTFLAYCRERWLGALVFALLAPLAYLLVLEALKLAPLSHVAPVREVSMLFAAVLGGTLLGEADRGLRLAGAACIGAGVVALALA